jgi:hypothetical protein
MKRTSRIAPLSLFPAALPLLFGTLSVLPAGPAAANNSFGVYINEVLYDPVGSNAGAQKIELVNKSGAAVSLTNWSLCIQFSYRTFPSGASIPAGGLYTIHVNATGTNTPTEWYTGAYVTIDAASDAVALYHTATGFATAANMEDFVQFGAGAQPRENVAAAAGLWTAGAFVAAAAEGQSLAYNGSGTLPHPVSDYCNETPTIGAANACGSQIGVPEAKLPRVLVLQSYPNPLHQHTNLAFDVLDREERITVTVFDVLGRPVRSLWSGTVGPGRKIVGWDGRDDRGRLLPAGTYVYTVGTEAGTSSGKMTLLR